MVVFFSATTFDAVENVPKTIIVKEKNANGKTVLNEVDNTEKIIKQAMSDLEATDEDID